MGPDLSGRGWCRMLIYRQGIGGLLRIAGKELGAGKLAMNPQGAKHCLNQNQLHAS